MGENTLRDLKIYFGDLKDLTDMELAIRLDQLVKQKDELSAEEFFELFMFLWNKRKNH